MSAELTREMGVYVGAAWNTYEDMREQRDQALIRADAAEYDLVVERAEVKQMHAAIAEVRRICLAEHFPLVSQVLDVLNAVLDGAQ